MRKHIGLLTSFFCFTTAVAGCGAPDATPPRVASPSGYELADRPPGLPSSAESYRVTRLTAPTGGDNLGYAFGGPRVRNQLGNILGLISLMYSPAESIQDRYDRAVTDGEVGLTLLVEHYDPGRAADTAITLDTKVADDGFTTLWGVSDGAGVEATGGDMTLSLSALPGIRIHAEAIRVAATVGDDGQLHGRVNGLIPVREMDKVYPVVAAAMNDFIRHARPGDADAADTLILFDANRDSVISPDEIADAPFMQTMVSPDVSLNVVDNGSVTGLSFGIGFDATKE